LLSVHFTAASREAAPPALGKAHVNNHLCDNVTWRAARKPEWLSTSSIYKVQTRPLVREGVPHKQGCNCQTVIINIWSWPPDWARHQDLLTDWLSVAMWLWLWLWLWDLFSLYLILEQKFLTDKGPRTVELRGKTLHQDSGAEAL
jgi:hypothetical protein